MMIPCRKCHQLFIPDKDTQEIIDQGFIDFGSLLCDDCWFDEENQDFSPDEFSDADSGI